MKQDGGGDASADDGDHDSAHASAREDRGVSGRHEAFPLRSTTRSQPEFRDGARPIDVSHRGERQRFAFLAEKQRRPRG